LTIPPPAKAELFMTELFDTASIPSTLSNAAAVKSHVVHQNAIFHRTYCQIVVSSVVELLCRLELANLLAGPLLRGKVRPNDLAAVQRKPEWVTRAMKFVQATIPGRALFARGRPRPHQNPERCRPSDTGASDKLLPLVYDELRQLAAQKLAQEPPGQTLQATALVHEAYLRLNRASVALMAFAFGVLVTAGCGGNAITVSGRVTCQGKPVSGVILFSPQDNDASSPGPSVSAPLQEGGRFDLRLTTTGKHTIVITPRDIVLRPKKGEFDYPCDRSPLTRDIQAGANDITIEMGKHPQ
jgi:hypothetical protein